MTATRSYYLQRGDTELRELNNLLDEVNMVPSDLVDFLVVPDNDGLRATLVYEDDRTLRLLGSSPPNNSWYQVGEFPAVVELAFNEPVSKDVSDGDIKVVTSLAVTNITLGDLTFSDEDRKITWAQAQVGPTYKGQVNISVHGLKNIAGKPMEPTTLGISVTDQDTQTPKTGENAYLYNEPQGLMQVGRLTAARGMDKDLLIQQYLIQKDLENSQVVKIVQIAGRNGSTEIFLIWWLKSTPRVMNISPAPNGTVASEDASDFVMVEFDEPVSVEHLEGRDGTTRVWLDGTPIQSAGTAQTPLDDVGRVWLISGWTGFQTAGNHVMLIKDLPSQYGERPGFFQLYSWQVLPMAITGGGGGGGGTNYCEVPTGSINGVNDTFILTQEPDACSLHLFRNGMFQDPTCYTLVGDTITTVDILQAGESLYAMYIYTAPGP